MAQFALDLERYLQGLSVYAAGIKSTGFSGPVLRAVQETEEERRRQLKRSLVLSALPLCLALLACLYVPRLLAVKTIPVFTDNDRRNSNLNRSSYEMLRKIGNEALRNENLVSNTKSLSAGSGSTESAVPKTALPGAQSLPIAPIKLSEERKRFFLTQLDCIADVFATKKR